MRAASFISLSSFARATSAAWCSASSRSRSRAAWIVRSNRRAFSIAVAVCSASVFSSLSSAAVYAIGTVLPSAITPITRSPTFSGAQISAWSAVWLATRRGSRVDVVDDLGDAARRDRADDAVAAPEAVERRQLVAEAGHRRQRAVASSSSMTTPSVATIRCRASCSVSCATRSTSSSAASFSEKL